MQQYRKTPNAPRSPQVARNTPGSKWSTSNSGVWKFADSAISNTELTDMPLHMFNTMSRSVEEMPSDKSATRKKADMPPETKYTPTPSMRIGTNSIPTDVADGRIPMIGDDPYYSWRINTVSPRGSKAPSRQQQQQQQKTLRPVSKKLGGARGVGNIVKENYQRQEEEEEEEEEIDYMDLVESRMRMFDNTNRVK